MLGKDFFQYLDNYIDYITHLQHKSENTVNNYKRDIIEFLT